MNKLFLLSIVFFGSYCFAGDAEEMRAILEANFAACNNEDVNALLETCSIDMPRREEFKRESLELWKEKDIYYRIVKFKIIKIERDYATASVVQLTHTKDRKSKNKSSEFIRNGTGLLSLKECVEYKIAFKKDNGKWKCYMTISEPVEHQLD